MATPSILTTIKNLLGIDESVIVFDSELVIHINSVISILSQLGVTSADNFSIVDDTAVWTDLLGDSTDLDLVKTYIYSKVKLVFDPPQNSFLVTNIVKQCEEYESRINMLTTPDPIPEEEGV